MGTWMVPFYVTPLIQRKDEAKTRVSVYLRCCIKASYHTVVDKAVMLSYGYIPILSSPWCYT
jgi:hypothetical protein